MHFCNFPLNVFIATELKIALQQIKTKPSLIWYAVKCSHSFVAPHPVVTVAGIRSMAAAGSFSLSWLSVVIKTQSRLLARGTVALYPLPCILLG